MMIFRWIGLKFVFKAILSDYWFCRPEKKENGGALCAPPLIANNWPIIACVDSDLYYSGGTMFTVSVPWMVIPL